MHQIYSETFVSVRYPKKRGITFSSLQGLKHQCSNRFGENQFTMLKKKFNQKEVEWLDRKINEEIEASETQALRCDDLF